MKNQQTLIRLTALWAFVEAGLGGFLHALHLPFTGIVLGGFAILIISLIAHFSDKPFQKIIEATLIVLAIKAIVNPATSPFAYIAVGFQGLLGACTYSVNKKYFVSHFIVATFSMLESAAQKLIIMTLIFGKTFWQGIDGLAKNVADIFGYSSLPSFSNQLVIIYLSIFFVWGLILSIWMHVLPTQIKNRLHKYQNIEIDQLQNSIQKKSKSTLKFVLALLIIFVAIASFFYNNASSWLNAFIYILRTLAVLMSWQIFILPFWQKFITKWSDKQKTNNKNFKDVYTIIPNIKNRVKPIYAIVSNEYSGLKKWKEFLLALIVVSINLNDE